MVFVEPMIVVLGPACGGTSAVAGILHHLGVYMGSEFLWIYREPRDVWEDGSLVALCQSSFTMRDGLLMDPEIFQKKLCHWADKHRSAARRAGQRPGAKEPRLCGVIDYLRACGPIIPVVVDRPVEKIMTSLTRLGWASAENEQEWFAFTQRMITERDEALEGTEAIRVDFETLRVEPESTILRLVDSLNLEVNESQVAAAVESIVGAVDAGDADPYGRDILMRRLERNPNDKEAVGLLADIWFQIGDFAAARKWFERCLELGVDRPEAAYMTMCRIAQSMRRCGEQWADVQDAFLRAWQFRPTRAEPLFIIARYYRVKGDYHLGYLFAKGAAAIPMPEEDIIFDDVSIYAWRAVDEQAVCASWIGRKPEALMLWEKLLARTDIPDEDRERITANRDLMASQLRSFTG